MTTLDANEAAASVAYRTNEVIVIYPITPSTPDHPVLRGTAQNPDTFFQAREAINPYYLRLPDIVQQVMDEFARHTGRSYRLFDYAGHPEAERVLILMGSGAETAQETAEYLNSMGQKVGVLKVRLYRPSPCPISSPRYPGRRARSPCSIAPRSLARWVSRFTSMW